MTKKVGFYTLGCKLNYAETEAIARNMSLQDYTSVPFSSFADYYVINTCSVTELANKKSRSAIRKALKINPEAIIIVIGCYAQLKPEEIAKIEGVSIVLSTKDKFAIPYYIKKLESSQDSHLISSCERDEIEIFNSSYSLKKRTRSFLKVQDGCNYFCSYCTIPLARGKSRNAPISQIVSQATEIANNNIREIVLTGINIGDFGRSTGETFFELIQELDKIKGINRYRISSIEPNLLTSEIIDFVRDSQKFMPHFHIPLQSGSNKVLQLMRRKYSTEFFAAKINEIHTKIPHAGIGIDVIVGTPGETEKLFMETYSFLQSLPISYLHVFTYSEREGTDALQIAPIVPKQERHKRSMLVHELSEKIQNNYFIKHDKTIHPVLIETNKNNIYTGYTDNYIKTKIYSEKDIHNTIQKIKLQHESHNHMTGEIL
ncbi:MAG: tRNA (N(6)-L-threonylcarbamoyladenosine(37)-C(2))-methylthiotransferase MtaB [Bacteroidota bacterium]